jgi:hypothetical protein
MNEVIEADLDKNTNINNNDNIYSIRKYGKIDILGSICYTNKIDKKFIFCNSHIKLIDNIKLKL